MDARQVSYHAQEFDETPSAVLHITPEYLACLCADLFAG
jgi:hypothetical protein